MDVEVFIYIEDGPVPVAWLVEDGVVVGELVVDADVSVLLVVVSALLLLLLLLLLVAMLECSKMHDKICGM